MDTEQREDAAAAPATGSTLQDEVRARFGVLPNFFRLAPETPQITANLWGFAKFAYLDNPLPSLFKERLFVYLSRFCEVRYCITRHVGFLIGLGRPSGDATVAPQSIDDVLHLLRNPLPQADALGPLIALASAHDATLVDLPPSDSAMETAVIACASHVFLQTVNAPACVAALKGALGESRWHHLTVFLAFVRTAHYWSCVHTELRIEDDLVQLLQAHGKLAARLLHGPDAVDGELSQRVAQELQELREQQSRHESERAHSREVLRASEERFRAAFESSVVGFAILELDTTFVQVNDAFCAIVGYSRDELRTAKCSSFTHPDDRAHADALVAQLLSDARPAFVIEKRYQRKDGALIWVQNSVSTTRDAAGRPQHLVVVCQDVTERRRASQMKDDFLATLSHELRTPLNAMLGWAQMLRTGALRPDRTGKALEALERNARAQAKLVDDLLDLSRIITGKLEIAADLVGLAGVIANAVDAVRPAAMQKHLELRVTADPSNECFVHGDASRLQQVVLNLLSNAVKFTPAHGAIDVDLGHAGGEAVIRVRDTGQGIGAALLPFVFDRFRQGDSSTTRRHGGLGLGLAIVRHLTEAHRGTAGVESGGEGSGTTFTLRFPLASVPSSAVSDAKAAELRRAPVSLHDARVLVVDDVPDARDLMRAALESVGARVTTASSAGEVLTIVDDQKFDLLVADIGMPDRDGYSLITALRQKSVEHGQNMPAIAVTAYATAADRDKALAAGFDRHLAKPLEWVPFIEAIADALAAGRQ